MEKPTEIKGVIAVPTTVWQKWTLNKSFGDVKAIAKKTKISEPTIRKALNEGQASLATQEAITGFYAEKIQGQKEAKKENEKKQLSILNGAAAA